ncbi:MAG: uridylate kinase [Candidatus Woesearchaeota archaeon]|nr:uridylate kinase [Candidatus Woesearchaeota archaeon]
MKKWVISLGGSVVVPKEINARFLDDFSRKIVSFAKAGYYFRIVCGGGAFARRYMNAVGIYSSIDVVHRIGMIVTRLNAELVKSYFPLEECYEKVVINYSRWKGSDKRIVIGAGERLGYSTDYDAYLFAIAENVKTILNITDVDYVYDKNPKKYGDAKPLERLRWKDYLEMVSSEFKPGDNFPFDPLASKACMNHNIKVIVCNSNLDNIEKILKGEKYIGTLLY